MGNGIIGIENEFQLIRGSNQPVDGGGYARDIIAFSKKPYFEKHDTAFRLWTGGAFYIDGREPEITTPPIEIRKGCIRQVISSLVQNRNNLVQMIDGYNFDKPEISRLSLKGYSTHYNFSCDAPQEITSELAMGPALPCLLLIEQKQSQGVMLRNKDERAEICGDYTVSFDQMCAAMAFMLGTINGLKAGRDIGKLRYDEAQETDELSHNYLISPEGERIKRKNLVYCNEKLMSLQEIFEYYFKIFREDIGKFADDEVELIEEYVSGRRKLEVDLARLPAGYNKVREMSPKRFVLPELAKAFSMAATGTKETKKLGLETENMEWDEIEIRDKTGDTIHIRRDNMPSFYSQLEANCSKVAMIDEDIQQLQILNMMAGNLSSAEIDWNTAYDIIANIGSHLNDKMKLNLAINALKYSGSEDVIRRVARIAGKEKLVRQLENNDERYIVHRIPYKIDYGEEEYIDGDYLYNLGENNLDVIYTNDKGYPKIASFPIDERHLIIDFAVINDTMYLLGNYKLKTYTFNKERNSCKQDGPALASRMGEQLQQIIVDNGKPHVFTKMTNNYVWYSPIGEMTKSNDRMLRLNFDETVVAMDGAKFYIKQGQTKTWSLYDTNTHRRDMPDHMMMQFLDLKLHDGNIYVLYEEDLYKEKSNLARFKKNRTGLHLEETIKFDEYYFRLGFSNGNIMLRTPQHIDVYNPRQRWKNELMKIIASA